MHATILPLMGVQGGMAGMGRGMSARSATSHMVRGAAAAGHQLQHSALSSSQQQQHPHSARE